MSINKYEVVGYTSGGFFIHGGSVRENYFKDKVDADLVCEALNMIERLKMRRFASKVTDTIAALEDLDRALKEGTRY